MSVVLMDPKKVKSARLVCLPQPLYSKGDRGGECWHNIQIEITTHDVLIVLACYNTKPLTVVVVFHTNTICRPLAHFGAI